MASIFRLVLWALLGLSLAVYGLVHSASSYPNSAVFARLVEAMPTLGAVSFFALGVLATATGVVLVVAAVRQLRRHWERRRQAALLKRAGRRDVPAPRRVPFGRDHDGGYGDEPGYHDTRDGGYPGSGYHPNGEADEREWTGAYR